MTEKKDAIAKVAETSLIQVTPASIKTYINDKASDQEIALFLNQCSMFGLNPFKREIYLIKYKQGDPATFVVGYEVYLKRAERTNKWAGMSSGTEDGPDGRPIKAWADVYRKDWPKPLHHEVFYDEYVGLKDEWKDNQRTGRRVPTRFWADKPKTMLKKVAIAQAMRMAFPDEMAGMPYIEEEIHNEEPASRDDIAGKILNPEYEASKRAPLTRVKDEFDPGDLTDPAVNPFEDAPPPPARAPKPAPRPAPNPEPEPEEEGLSFSEEFGAEVAEAHKPREPIKKPEPENCGPTMPQLEKFARLKTDLKALGIDEQTLWAGKEGKGGIANFSAKNFGKTVTELGDMTPMEMDMMLDYMARWRAAKQPADAGQSKPKRRKD